MYTSHRFPPHLHYVGTLRSEIGKSRKLPNFHIERDN